MREREMREMRGERDKRDVRKRDEGHSIAQGCRSQVSGQGVGPYTWLTDAVRGRMHKVAGLRAKKFCTRLQVSGPNNFAQGCRFQGQKVLHKVAVHSCTLSGSLPIVWQGLRPEFVL